MSNTANKGGIERVNPLGPGFTRGPARILVAPYASAYPTSIGSIVNLEEESKWKNEKQKIEKFPEVPTEGTFYLGFGNYPTKALKYNVTQEEVQKALEELPTIGSGGIVITSTKSKPLSEEAMKYEFGEELKNHSQPLVQVLRNTCKKSSVVQALVVSREQAGFGEYDPVGEWTELGATKNGIKITRNNTESLIDIDQIQAAVGALPDEWEMSVETSLAETNEEILQIAWEGAPITVNATTTPNENIMAFGNPLSYEERRLAVVHRITLGSNKNKLKAFVFRKVLRSATPSTIDFMKTGNLSTVQTTFKVFADASVANPLASMGEVREQNYF